MKPGTRCETSRSWRPDRPERSARPSLGWEASSAGRALALLLLGLTVWRAWTVVHVGAGLHVDEAQYWAWSQALDWGYYSKPPMIAGIIALSTALLGDGLLGVKALAMLCYPLTAWVLYRWVGEVAADVAAEPDARAERAGWLAALLFIASPVAGLLGLAATTDAPLLLMWSLAARSLWRAWRDGRRIDWLMLGLWGGLGLMSKYTMAAFAISALGVLLTVPRRRSGGLGLPRGLALSALVAFLCILPNLAWNAAHGWPTLRHTAEITVGAQSEPLLQTVGGYLGGLLLLVGPVVVPWMLLWAWRARGDAPLTANSHEDDGQPTRREAAWMAAWLAGPLAAIGAAQALHAQAELNWAAPVLIGTILGLVLWLRPERRARHLGGWYAALAAQAVLIGALTLAGDLAHWLHHPLPRQLDVWARMRGWDQAFDLLKPAVREHWAKTGVNGADLAAPLVLGEDRAVLANGAYAWRELAPQWTAWRAPGELPHDHFQLSVPLRPSAQPQPILIVGAGRPEASLLAALARPPRRVAVADVEQTPGRRLHLELWEAELAPQSPDMAQAERPPAATRVR
ncbi:glycosyltransferase family 39 protein [Ideonella sp. YS5]|uniref:glycosyltransferase family 39 protein n=1 Tax=Ideonella sp. YS5 TaxID=3453714 RepID=UPI003EED70E7